MTHDHLSGMGECLTDPGPLSHDDAVHVMAMHHSCPDECWPQRRARETFDAEYTASFFPMDSPSPDDTKLARLLREAIRLTPKSPRVKQPVERG
ncbi:hypothetical protein [Nocardia sp. NBC_01009]|uniref:hypothetical protein n=1 Tax=Nocardia sp. NBC_01009 TaxID=2975996 RepID=UPI00386E3CA1|nr:hypothetical protein OHA42_04845 [Nocardia sp. NBC_01009]